MNSEIQPKTPHLTHRAPSISVVLPAYREELNIGPMVEMALEALPGMAEEFEILVVDDGSADGTGAVARALVDQHHPKVRLISHSENRGYGAALRTGFKNAISDLVFYTDSDRQFDLTELAYFLPLMEDNDLVIGFRVYRYDSALRSFVSWGYNRLVGLLFRIRVRDVDCAYKLMRREVLANLQLQTDDFFIDTEIVARSRRWNFRMAQKGVRHYPRMAGETTVQPSDILRTLKTIGRMWRRIHLPTTEHRDEAQRATEEIVGTEYEPQESAAPSQP